MSELQPDMELVCNSLEEKVKILELIEKVTIKMGYWPNTINNIDNSAYRSANVTLSLKIELLDGHTKSFYHDHIASHIMSIIFDDNGNMQKEERNLKNKLAESVNELAVESQKFDVKQLPPDPEPEHEPPEPDPPQDDTIYKTSAYLHDLDIRGITIYLGRGRDKRSYAVENEDLEAAIAIVAARRPLLRMPYAQSALPGVGIRRAITREFVLEVAKRVACAIDSETVLFSSE